MKIIETGFDGLLLCEPKCHFDDRGFFYESFRENVYKELGIKDRFVQDSQSLCRKHVLKGLHFQKNQSKLLTVVHGKVFDVMVDIRPNSRTYKKYFSVELDASCPKQLYASYGFAHGLYVLSDWCVLSYKTTQYYDASQEGGILWNDTELGIAWPLVSDPIVSKRDQSFSTIGQIK